MPYSSVGRGRGKQFRRVATVHTGPSTAPRILLRPTVCGSSPYTTIPKRVLWEREASDACVCPIGYELYRGTHPRGRGSLVSIVPYPLGHQWKPGQRQTAGRQQAEMARQVSLAPPSVSTHRDTKEHSCPHLLQSSR